MHEWRPEVVVDAGWARRLIGTQFPELELGSLRLFGEGWGNTVWLVDERWVFRFPRREVVIPGFERELAVLPRLAERLPLSVPAPVFHGRPDGGFPWPFSGAALLPVDANGRADMPARVGLTVDRLAQAERLGVWRAPDTVAGILAEARALRPPPEPATLAHGDLHIRHLLVGADGRLSGVIDWIDVCRGDPGIDLGVYWSFVPPEGRAAFAAEYGPIAPDALLRARLLAVFLCATVALYGREQDDAELERGAVAALDRSVAG